jgi:hypothetical protein
VIPKDIVDWLFTECRSLKTDKIEKVVTEITLAGYSASQIIAQVTGEPPVCFIGVFLIPSLVFLLFFFSFFFFFFFFKYQEKIVTEICLNDAQKALLSQKIAQVDRCLLDGADEHLQLLDLAFYTVKVFEHRTG